MEHLDVRIVRLDPLRVASAAYFGDSPEGNAWLILQDFAAPRRLLEPASGARIFGFNNPDPTPGSPNYGYEMWITVGADAIAEPPVEIKEVPGGLYAVTRCVGVDSIFPAWQRLVAWVEASRYLFALDTQCLEEHVKFLGLPWNEYVMDLYLPVTDSIN